MCNVPSNPLIRSRNSSTVNISRAFPLVTAEVSDADGIVGSGPFRLDVGGVRNVEPLRRLKKKTFDELFRMILCMHKRSINSLDMY